MYVFANGDKYVGEFRDGLYDGRGVLAQASGEYIECRWRGGLPLSDSVQSARGKARARTKRRVPP